MGMNLKQGHNLLSENIQLKKDKIELENKLLNLINDINVKMSSIMIELNEIKSKQSNQQQIIINNSNNKELEHNKDIPIFIPSPDSSNLKMNSQEIQKIRKISKIDDTIDKLSKLTDK